LKIYESVKNVYKLNTDMLAHSKTNLRMLNRQHRATDIDPDVDGNEKAYYFKQAQDGLYIRQDIVSKVLS